MPTKTNPDRRAAKLAQRTTKEARAAVSAAARGYSGSAHLHITAAASANQHAAEVAPGSTHAQRANQEYLAACRRLSAMRDEHDRATDYHRDEIHPETPQPQP